MLKNGMERCHKIERRGSVDFEPKRGKSFGGLCENRLCCRQRKDWSSRKRFICEEWEDKVGKAIRIQEESGIGICRV